MKIKIKNLELEIPILNASGPRCTTEKDLLELGKIPFQELLFLKVVL